MAQLNLPQYKRPMRQKRLPVRLRNDFVLPSYADDDAPSVRSSTVGSRLDRLQIERDSVRDEVDRYRRQAEDLICRGASVNAFERLESRLEKSFTELKELTSQIYDTGEEQFPQEIEDAAHVLRVTKEQIEDCQDRIAEMREEQQSASMPQYRAKGRQSSAYCEDLGTPSYRKPKVESHDHTSSADVMSEQAKLRDEMAALKSKIEEKERDAEEQRLREAEQKFFQRKLDEDRRANEESELRAKHEQFSLTKMKQEMLEMLHEATRPPATRKVQIADKPTVKEFDSTIPGVQSLTKPSPVLTAQSHSPRAPIGGDQPSDKKTDDRELRQFFQGMAKPAMPKFRGEKTQFADWWEHFELFVHQTDIPTRFKMVMLKNSLTDGPAELVKRLGYSDSQYELAVRKLKARYGGEKRLLQRHMDAIIAVQLLREDDLPGLESFSNSLQDIVAKLIDAGREDEVHGPSSLYTLAMQRLPDTLLVGYEMDRIKKGQEGLSCLSEWLSEQVIIRLEIAELKDSLKKNVRRPRQEMPSRFKATSREPSRAHQSSVHATEAQTVTPRVQPVQRSAAPPTSEITCAVCQEEHRTIGCPKWQKATVQDRWDMAKKYKICFRCLLTGHQGRNCRSTKKCGVNGCDKTHHRGLHPTTRPAAPQAQKSYGTTERTSSSFGIENGNVITSKVALRLTPVLITGNDGVPRKVHAFLDDGSDSTYIRASLAKELGLIVEDKPLTVATLTSKGTRVESGLVQIAIESLDGTICRKIGARTLERLCEDLRSPDWTKLKTRWPHLVGIDFPALEGRRSVDLLIGSDHPELTLALEEKVGKPGEPVARRTPLGWTCVGSFGPPTDCGVVSYAQAYCSGIRMDEELKKLWDSDVLEPQPKSDLNTPDEKLALEKAEGSMKCLDERYEVGIPWKKEAPSLPDNKDSAEKRLHNLEKSLKRKPEVAERYREVFADNLSKGYIEEVTPERLPNLGWYLPHFGVVREDRQTTKVRVVYDAAAKYRGKCLNDEMFAGPKLQLDILDILIAFRRGAIALVGDIKEMFCQVAMAESDQKYHRILWRDLDETVDIKVYEAKRLIFGDRSSPFLAQLVIRVHAKKHESEYPLAADVCSRFIYMDDAMRSLDSVELVKELREQLTKLLASAGFVIRKWCSNSAEVMSEIPEGDKASGIQLDESELPSIKALGVRWNAESDTFGYYRSDAQLEIATKRNLLSVIARLFDPLQLLAPFIIKAKFLLQQAWMAGLEWDEEFPAAMGNQAKEWVRELTLVEEFEVPRCLHKGSPQETSLHTFADASKLAYAAAVYIRHVYLDGSVSIRIVVAKARVAPVKAISIPRLELMAAVLGLRLAVRANQLLQINTMYYWSDSMDVILWIHGRSRQYKPFVAHRVGEIHESSMPSQWRHVPGLQNPADLATRGTTMRELIDNNFWTEGPSFLQKSEDEWPEVKVPSSETPSEEAQVESAKLSFGTTTKGSTSEDVLSSPIDCNRFSSWLRLTRTTAWVLRFLKMAKAKDKSQLQKPHLEVSEIEEGKKYWIRRLQMQRYGSTIEHLENQTPYPSCPLRNLATFLDSEGILRVGGRLQHSDLPYKAKHPAIVPAKSHLTTLIVRHVHCHVTKHAKGVNAALAELRQEYWVTNGREEVKKVDYRCVECRKRKKKSAKQIMAPLPSLRVKIPLRAFAKIGVDFAGPFLVKVTRRVQNKRWLCLFTCVATRAVHLEMAYSMDTPGFLNTFSRMVARRGKPVEVVSDNGTNFVGADRELGELVQALDQQRIVDEAASEGIDWHFNPPLGSHHGGIFEALIKSAKKALKAILGQASLTDEELQTAIVETEGLLNSRPLTYTSSDPKDDDVLTPNHFLIGQAGGQLAPHVVDEIAFNPRHRWRYVQDLVKQIWNRWNKEFLTLLQTRKKWWVEERDLAVDDIVLMADSINMRGKWPLGRITEVMPGSDGHVRAVRVLSGGKSYVRPITKLCPIIVKDVESQEKVAVMFGHGGEDVEASSCLGDRRAGGDRSAERCTGGVELG